MFKQNSANKMKSMSVGSSPDRMKKKDKNEFNFSQAKQQVMKKN